MNIYQYLVNIIQRKVRKGNSKGKVKLPNTTKLNSSSKRFIYVCVYTKFEFFLQKKEHIVPKEET